MNGMELRYPESDIKNLRVIDGDTIAVEVTQKIKLRLSRINTPELRSKDPEEKERALAAKAYVENRLAEGKVVKFITYEIGNFGRFLVDIFIDGSNLNNELIEKGLATLYKPSRGRKNKK